MKLSEEKRAMIKSYAKHNSRRQTAKRFGVCHTTVCHVAGTRKVVRTVSAKEKTPNNGFFRHEDFGGI